MGQEIFLKNYKFLKSRCKWIFKDIDEYEKEELSVCTYKTEEQTTGAYIDLAEQGVLQLGSQYEPKKWADLWVQYVLEKDPVESNSTVFLFGLGSGEYLKALLSFLPEDCKIIVYEPSIEILKATLRIFDFTELSIDRICIVSSGVYGGQAFQTIIKSFVNYQNVLMVRSYVLPNYSRFFNERYLIYNKRLKDEIENIVMTLNTVMAFSKSIASNVLKNLYHAIKSYSLRELIEKMPKQYPVIVIAAGPSLEKNIELLKKAKGKAFLLATDTAMKPLLKHGIIPDCYHTVDPEKWDELFDDERIRNIPLIVDYKGKEKIVKQNQNKVFFSYDDGSMKNFFKLVQKEYEGVRLPTGGSVANSAFSFALNAGMDPIIFVGQDLAYTNNKKHIDGAFQGKQTVTENEQKRTVLVEDITGEMIPSLRNLLQYKKWFEDVMVWYPQRTFIDATEGGAKIKGTEIMTLQEALDRYCTKKFDYEALIAGIEPMLKEKEKNVCLQKLISLEEELEDIKMIGDNLIRQYMMLQKMAEQKNIEKESLGKILGNVKNDFRFLEEESVLYPMIESYIARESLRATINVAKTYDDVSEDLMDIVTRGLIMAEAMNTAVGELRPFIQEFVKEIKANF